jgi:hypothetical protein
MTLEEIQQAIAKLPEEDVARLRVWLARLAGSPSPPPPQAGEASDAAEPQSTAEKLGRFAGRAFADLRRRVREK